MINTPQGNLPEIAKAITFTETDGTSWIDLSSQPSAVEEIGSAIADHAAALGATAVVSWWDAEETVLAHVIASHLGVRRSAVDRDLGLLTLSPQLPEACRVLLVATSFDHKRPLESLRTLLEGQRHIIVGAASIDSSTGVTVSPLTDMRPPASPAPPL